MDNIETFFVDYARAMDAMDIDYLVNVSVKPMVFVSDETKQICATSKEIESVYNLLLGSLQSGGITQHSPCVVQSMRLSAAMRFVSIRWEFKDANQRVEFTCSCSYTMQTNRNGVLKVLVVVLDDEQKVISGLMKAYEETQRENRAESCE